MSVGPEQKIVPRVLQLTFPVLLKTTHVVEMACKASRAVDMVKSRSGSSISISLHTPSHPTTTLKRGCQTSLCTIS